MAERKQEDQHLLSLQTTTIPGCAIAVAQGTEYTYTLN